MSSCVTPRCAASATRTLAGLAPGGWSRARAIVQQPRAFRRGPVGPPGAPALDAIRRFGRDRPRHLARRRRGRRLMVAPGPCIVRPGGSFPFGSSFSTRRRRNAIGLELRLGAVPRLFRGAHVPAPGLHGPETAGRPAPPGAQVRLAAGGRGPLWPRSPSKSSPRTGRSTPRSSSSTGVSRLCDGDSRRSTRPCPRSTSRPTSDTPTTRAG